MWIYSWVDMQPHDCLKKVDPTRHRLVDYLWIHSIFYLSFFTDSTTCTPFNVASQTYGGSCLNQSSSSGAPNDCQYVLDGKTAVGWESATNEGVNAFITIGFHTTFTINKLRVMQKTASGQQIQEILLDFSDCSKEKVSHKAAVYHVFERAFLACS